MAPELFEKVPSYSADKVDVWALGVCLFYLVEGTYPFRGYDDKDLARKIRQGRFTMCKGSE
jgi:serine/threonine protein kinase